MNPDDFGKGASRYDVHSGGGKGGHGKVDIVSEVALILQYKSVPNADKGETKIPKLLWMSHMEAP